MMPHHARIEFIKNKAFLEKTIADFQGHKKIVVLTHHAPSFYKTSAPIHSTCDSRYAFASKLSCHHTLKHVNFVTPKCYNLQQFCSVRVCFETNISLTCFLLLSTPC